MRKNIFLIFISLLVFTQPYQTSALQNTAQTTSPAKTREDLSQKTEEKAKLKLLELSISREGSERASFLKKFQRVFPQSQDKDIQVLTLNGISHTPHRLISNLFRLEQSLDTDDEQKIDQIVRGFLQKHQNFLNLDESQLRLLSQRKVNGLANIYYFIHYQQYYQGIPVYKALTTLRIDTKEGKIPLIGVDFYSDIHISPKPKVSAEEAIRIAKEDIGFNDSTDRLLNEPSLIILPVSGKKYLLVWTFILSVKGENFGEWRYFVDANTNEVIVKRNEIDFEKNIDLSEIDRPTIPIIFPFKKITDIKSIYGKSEGMILPNYWDDIPEMRPFANESIQLSTADETISDQDGEYKFKLPAPDVYTMASMLEGPYVKVYNDDAEGMSYERILNPGYHDIEWMVNYDAELAALAQDEGYMDQTNAFYHVNRVHSHVKNILGYEGMDWLIPVTIRSHEVDDAYGGNNAFYSRSGKKIEVGRGGTNARNYALFSDLFYHEFTHAVNDAIYEPVGGVSNGAISEGSADYFASTLNGDPWHGRGRYYDNEYSRTLDNDYKYPDDYIGESHWDGQIFAGALWDLREVLGNLTVDSLAHNARFGFPETFADYEYEMLLLDDNDGDLSNGTLHFDEIFLSFVRHGIGIYVEGISIDDNNYGQSQGNNNFIAEAGETIELRIEFVYELNIPFPDGVVVLSTLDPFVNIRMNEYNLSNLQLGRNEIEFIVDISSGMPRYHGIEFDNDVYINDFNAYSSVIRTPIVKEINVTNSSSARHDPIMYEDKVVWTEYDSLWDIYMHDLSTGETKKVVVNAAEQDSPYIYQDKIVWSDWRNGNPDIYLYDISTDQEKQITTNTAYQVSPSIYQDKIIWEDWRNVTRDIYLYDLTLNQEKRITTNWANQEYPAIYGDKIVWQDYRNGNYDIYLYDLTLNQEKRITTNNANQEYPAIYGDKIVWQDDRNGNYDIYSYDLTTSQEIQITFDNADQKNPSIYEDKIVWEDYRHGNADIYMYDLSSGQENYVVTNSGDQTDPFIYGEKIIWVDNRDGEYNIYLGELSVPSAPPVLSVTTLQITADNYQQEYPAIYGDKVVWQDNRNGNYDIYLYDVTVGEETQITANSADQKYPAIYEDKIVWEDRRDGRPSVYLYDLTAKEERKINLDSSQVAYTPDIYKGKVVWTDYSHIYVHDLTSGQTTMATTNSGSRYIPAIYEDKIVWQDYRNGASNSDIYMVDIITGQEIPISAHQKEEGRPAIYQDKIVWDDFRNDQRVIYFYDLNSDEERQVSLNSTNQGYPDIYQDKVVWYDYRDGRPDVYLYDLTQNQELPITSDWWKDQYHLYPQIYGDMVVWQSFAEEESTTDIYMATFEYK